MLFYNKGMIQTLGMIAAVVLPLWNIPLILRIERRKSSKDLSLAWALGVFTCLLAMAPSAWVSQDRIFTLFSVVNLVLFSGVVLQALRYR